MDNLQKQPKKGILRTSSNTGQPDNHKPSIEPIKWDEMNILQTLHPPGKDYGLIKIEEPKTPFSHYKDTVDGEPVSDDEGAGSSSTAIDLQTISEKINLCKATMRSREGSLTKSGADTDVVDNSSDAEDEEYEELSEEEKKKRKEFEMKRKMHYNEFQAVKIARKLLEEENDEDGDEEEMKRKGGGDEDGENPDDEEGMASDREVERDFADEKNQRENL